MRPPRTGAPRTPTKETAWSGHEVHPLGSGVDQPRTISTRAKPTSNRHTAHTDQATQAAVRWLILPIPRSCWLAPSVTTTTLQHHRLQSITTNIPRRVF